MADRKYAVTFGGELIEGMTPARLRERLSKLSEPIAAAQIDALLAARNATVKLFADRESADRFVGVLREAGMVCWLRLLHPGEAAHALLDDVIAAPTETIAVAPAPVITAARRPMLGPGAMTALIVLAIGGSIAAWYAWPESARHQRAAAPAADSSPAPAPVASEPMAPPAPAEPQPVPIAQARTTSSLMVPEPTLVISAKRDKPKVETPPPAVEAAKLEAPKAEPVRTSLPAGSGVATFAPMQTTAPAPAIKAAPTQVAMISPRAPAADVIVPPSYDRSKVPQPKYPAQAYRNGDQGEVLLSVLVGPDGKAKRVSVDRTSGSTLLDRAAMDTVRAWQFSPGTRNGVPQEAARQVAIGFKLGDQ